jgi:nucleoside phosphorylase
MLWVTAMSKGVADVAILTVIPAELHAALAVFDIPETSRQKDGIGTVSYHGQIFSKLGNRSLSVAIGCIGMARNPSAAAAAAEFIQRHQPRVFFLLGIAAGLRGRVKIGEVLFSDRVVAYESSAFMREGERTWVEPRPDIDRISHAMSQDLITYRPDPMRIARNVHRLGIQTPTPLLPQEAEFQEHVTRVPSSRIATIASGEKLLRDPEELHSIRTRLHGKVEAGEMEAAGVVAACTRRGVPWLVVRGISDFGDELKNDAFHGYAAGMAAATLADFIEYGLDLGRTEVGEGAQPLVVSITELIWPYADFSIVNTADHPVQITGTRIRRIAVLPNTHEDWDEVEVVGSLMEERIPLSVKWDTPPAADRVNVLGSRVLNLMPGEAAAFRLDLSTRDFIAVVALEVDWISAKTPKKSVMCWQDFLTVQPSGTYREEGTISVISGPQALDWLVRGRPPVLWQEHSLVDGQWAELLVRSAGHLSRHDPEGSFEKLRQAYESTASWGSILASFAEAYGPPEGWLWERIESCIRKPLHAQQDSFGIADARVIIDRTSMYRKGSGSEWLLEIIDSGVEGPFDALQRAAFERFTSHQEARNAEYLLALTLAPKLFESESIGLTERLVQTLSLLPSPPPANLLHDFEIRRGSALAAQLTLVAWWKQARLQPGLAVFNWHSHSPLLARLWGLVTNDAEEEELAASLRSPEFLVRYAVAIRPELPASIEAALTRDTSREVRRALARNPTISKNTLQILGDNQCWVAKQRLFYHQYPADDHRR